MRSSINQTIRGTYHGINSIPADQFGRPNTNPPSIVDEDNVTLYKFTLNTDRATYKFIIPDIYAGGDVTIDIMWTNDGGADDNTKNVKW